MIRSLLLIGLSICGLQAACNRPFAQQPPAPLSVDEQLARVPPALLDSRVQANVRIEGLNSAANDQLGLINRPALVERLRKIMTDTQQPPALRLAILGQLTTLYFPMTHTMTGKRDGFEHDAHAAADAFNAEVRTLLDDKDPRLQKVALAWLSMFQDPEATKRAVDVLQGKGRAPLSTGEAIGVLSFVDAASFYPVIYTAYRGTRDVTTREAALRVLGNYAPAREDLRVVALAPQEPVRLRRAALETLFAVDREGFPKTASRLLNEQSKSSNEIASVVITLMRVARSQPTYRERKLKGYDDDFDRGVRALLKQNSALRDLAHQYLLDTDPTYKATAR